MPEFEQWRLVERVNHDGEYVGHTVDHDQLVDVRLLLASDHLFKLSSGFKLFCRTSLKKLHPPPPQPIFFFYFFLIFLGLRGPLAADDADAPMLLMRLFCCCADAVDVLMLLVRRCC